MDHSTPPPSFRPLSLSLIALFGLVSLACLTWAFKIVESHTTNDAPALAPAPADGYRTASGGTVD